MIMEYVYCMASCCSRGVCRMMQSIFVLCDACHWCVTRLDKIKLATYDKCPQCSHAEMVSSFPILLSESLTFNYTKKRGVQLDFKHRIGK